MKTFLTAVLALALSASTTAQTAAFKSVTKPCPASNGLLSISGVPKQGSSFTVSGIAYPSRCTLKFCGCNVGPCNVCSGSLLVIGISQINVPLPGGCNLHVSPDIIMGAAFPGSITFPVPNNIPGGLKFYLQRADVSIDEVITPACATTYVPSSFQGFSDAVEGTVGT